jgi:hypothetical protein
MDEVQTLINPECITLSSEPSRIGTYWNSVNITRDIYIYGTTLPLRAPPHIYYSHLDWKLLENGPRAVRTRHSRETSSKLFSQRSRKNIGLFLSSRTRTLISVKKNSQISDSVDTNVNLLVFIRITFCLKSTNLHVTRETLITEPLSPYQNSVLDRDVTEWKHNHTVRRPKNRININ